MGIINDNIAKIRGMIYEQQDFLSDLADAVTSIEEEIDDKKVAFVSEAVVEDNFYKFKAVLSDEVLSLLITDKVEEDEWTVEGKSCIIDMLMSESGIKFVTEKSSKKMLVSFLDELLDRGWL